MTHRVLIVDDEKTFRVVAEAALTAEGYEVQAVSNGREALEAFRQQPPDLVVLDRNLPDSDGLSLLERFRTPVDGQEGEPPLVLMATAYADVEHAVQALKLGAYDYLAKPLQLPELVHKVSVALRARRLQRQVGALGRRVEERLKREVHLGLSPSMRRVAELVDAVAQSPNTTVLIEGESGTGKQVVAQLIHQRTRSRSAEPFIELNAASLPETFVESEIFGYERGAFTDAKALKPGLLELADGGSFFLDEVGELPAAAQAKLLKVLETSSFRRLGGTRDVRTDVRFIAATNRDLAQAVREGQFRSDLYHRLDVFRIPLSPLRERPEDLLPLAEAFTREFSERMGKRIEGLSAAAEERLSAYSYPGNVRELRNVIERAVILEAGEELSAASILLNAGPPSPVRASAGSQDLVSSVTEQLGRPPTLEELERAYLIDLLDRAGGNKAQVARWMGVSYPTVTRKIAEFGLGTGTPKP